MVLTSRISFLFFVVLLAALPGSDLKAQSFRISGTVADTSGIAIPGATVFAPVIRKGTTAGEDGKFSLELSVGQESVMILVSSVGYITDTLLVSPRAKGVELGVKLRNEVVSIEGVNVVSQGVNRADFITVPVAASAVIPSLSGSIEAVVITMPGVASFSELSSQYSVRGGSYDENLIYINDIEIYRPYLVRTGQQEGLSQINPDLAASVRFSPGGFNATYGDRMSSVLDIRYRRPEAAEASVSLSMLTSSVHAGAVSKDGKFYFLAGARYRSNAILLKSPDATGQYKPLFTDLQIVAGYSPEPETRVTLTMSASSNRYMFFPESQTTTFGSVTAAYKLFAYFEGGERDKYENLNGALTYNKRHSANLNSSVVLAGHLGAERENFDIRGAYSLSALDETTGSENNPDSLPNIGVGSWLSHARNSLTSEIASVTYRGSLNSGNNFTEWGVTGRYRLYRSVVSEWERVDSAGYTLSDDPLKLVLTSFEASRASFRSFSSSAFINNRTRFSFAGIKWDFTAGVRAFLDTYNSEIIISPRVSATAELSGSLSAHISIGAYNQPPGGRELTRPAPGVTGTLKAQRSYHLETGAVYTFRAWDRPFSLTADLYGKKMERIIPYLVDNVRMIYYGGNIARGYAAGLDLRVNGEFVEGTESWFSLSVMKSEMNIPSSSAGWFPSPLDQRVNLDIFFQDYLPGHPDLRAHINIVFGTGVPASPPGRDPWEINFRMPPYRRIDIGFSKVLIGEVKGIRIGRKDRGFKEMIAGLEVFNLADTRNTISYNWIRSVRNSEGISIEYAVPVYLTGRSLNLRLSARF